MVAILVPPHACSGCQKTGLQITGETVQPRMFCREMLEWEMLPAPRYTMILVVGISFQLQMFPLFRRLDRLWLWLAMAYGWLCACVL